MNHLPRLVITGASGFIGRHLLAGLKESFKITAMARRSQSRAHAPVHENIRWVQVDIRHNDLVKEAFNGVREEGGADFVIHLAAHYDFTGENHYDYQRTNVDGLHHVLDQCATLDLKRFVFASSIAACDYPGEGSALDESSPPDGKHIYARSKAIGEDMLAEYDDSVPSCITRFAALFSDWCEYPPLYFFLETWLSKAWNRRVIGGRGNTAIPYLHVREMVPFMRSVLTRADDLEQREILLASPDATMNHRDLFRLVHVHAGTPPRRPFFIPKPLCAIGIPMRDLVGGLLGSRPFERGWMVDHIDKNLLADPHRTWARLGWRPRSRLLIWRRMPFLLEHRKTDAIEWNHRNEAAMKEPWVRPNLVIHKLLENHMDEVRAEMLRQVMERAAPEGLESYQKISKDVFDWRVTVVYRHLLNAVRTNDKGIFIDYCKDLAGKRHAEGFQALEVCNAVRLLQRNILKIAGNDPQAAHLKTKLQNLLDMTVEFGCDQIVETYEELGEEVPDENVC